MRQDDVFIVLCALIILCINIVLNSKTLKIEHKINHKLICNDTDYFLKFLQWSVN